MVEAVNRGDGENAAAASVKALIQITTDVLAENLGQIIGRAYVTAAMDELLGWASDVYSEGVPPELVVAPGSVEEVCRCVAECTRSERMVIPIGGGYSYTAGYLAVAPRTIMIDLRRLATIVEINPTDSYVTVEAGCTWQNLYAALQQHGLRTPFFGPMSGYSSTVGGALSQGAFFLGSTQYGTAAESTLGLDVCLADGSLVRTGSGATADGWSPFFRTYGPDLTGIFLSDSGALGIKLRVTLKVIPIPTVHRFATYAFLDEPSVLDALAEIARVGIAADCYAWDPAMAENAAARTMALGEGMRYLLGIVRTAPSIIGGATSAAKVALATLRRVPANRYLLHATVDEVDSAPADSKIKRIDTICKRAGGAKMAAAVPRALRGKPFSAPTVVAPSGERWVATHALVPHSRVHTVVGAFRQHMEARRPTLDQFGIRFRMMFFAVGSNALCIEPLFYWSDCRLASHERLMGKKTLDTYPRRTRNPAATDAMMRLREELAELFLSLGCAHAQIGKFYRFQRGRDRETWALLKAIKCAVDPNRRMNPTSLGL